VFKTDGGSKDAAKAANFKVSTKPVSNLFELSALLTDLENKPDLAIIRGRFVGKDRAPKGDKPGTYRRDLETFEDQPLHSLMIDIDKFVPAFGDPVDEPDICIDGYIRKILPPAFHGASYHWSPLWFPPKRAAICLR